MFSYFGFPVFSNIEISKKNQESTISNSSFAKKGGRCRSNWRHQHFKTIHQKVNTYSKHFWDGRIWWCFHTPGFSKNVFRISKTSKEPTALIFKLMMSNSVKHLEIWISQMLRYVKYSSKAVSICSCIFEAFLHNKRCEKDQIWWKFLKFQKTSKKSWNMSGDLN